MKIIQKEKKQSNETQQIINNIIKEIWDNDLSIDFRYPVDKQLFPDYYLVIDKAVDLSLIKKQVKSGKYKKISDFEDDLFLMYKNCRYYNKPDSNICVKANSLEEQTKKILKKYLKRKNLNKKNMDIKTSGQKSNNKKNDKSNDQYQTPIQYILIQADQKKKCQQILPKINQDKWVEIIKIIDKYEPYQIYKKNSAKLEINLNCLCPQTIDIILDIANKSQENHGIQQNNIMDVENN